MAVKSAATNTLHHRQVLQIIVRLEQCISCEEFDENASDTPDITREGPTETENNLWCPVMASRDDRRVVLVLERSRTEVDESDLSIEKDFTLSSLSINRCR
jgi:hypothetical protein